MVRHTGKDFIDVKGIAVATMILLQSSGVQSSEFDAPEADRFPSDDDASLSQEVFYVTVAQVEAVVEPYRIGNDISWESVAFIGVHPPILAIWGS